MPSWRAESRGPMGTTPPTDSVSAVIYAISGGKYVVRLTDSTALPGSRSGEVLDSDGQVIGSASDYIYGGRGFAVHTRAFGGYVSSDQILFQHEMVK